ncbi:MAG TPA: hypothetical protein VGQ09_03685 [Chitinophagaceae bacterium]|jgi:hypothetical protein|nr:hypothetical protein [Chitinophagaceae bacterium]
MKKNQTAGNDKRRSSPEKDLQTNHNKQGVDKVPGEEVGKGEKVNPRDLKGKKVDADPSQESDRPAE